MSQSETYKMALLLALNQHYLQVFEQYRHRATLQVHVLIPVLTEREFPTVGIQCCDLGCMMVWCFNVSEANRTTSALLYLSQLIRTTIRFILAQRVFWWLCSSNLAKVLH